uniref:NADH-ubiquinone oxidoreductase chain 3 n=1 Tax=Dolichosciara megumiae TaxID=2715056 RepID=A0A6G7GC44_9DIPT|nr:NADH dehydrogenase subunit 3 [Dolichosciara megumiae]QIH95783.1 NADH dehydrogenase subunit 3 [Dolichosciara megumiae]
MLNLLVSMTIIFIISNIMMILASILSKKSFYDREKNSPFECGFDPKSSSRLPFSLRFFLITIIFLIFDVEITLIFPMIPMMTFAKLSDWFFTSMFFVTILIMGLFHEWNQGALEWSN